MGLYSAYVFPRLMDWLMQGKEFQRLRSALLTVVRGDVLEIGFGSGLNLTHYPPGIRHLTAADPARFLPLVVARRRAVVSFPVEIHQLAAEALPFDDHRFDWVVSTWTLCSIADPLRALAEVRRVLTPEGRFIFLEHGRCQDDRIAAWQDRLNPIQNVLGCGCHLNRRIDRLIEQASFRLIRLDRFHMTGAPRLVGAMYQGWAEPSPANRSAEGGRGSVEERRKILDRPK
ncbi:MAG: class I SAM-dependent methyltransferase [Nitrospira sp.]|nr:class I SAM-dependent methyltransferase [Nitrospira sp.]